MTFDQGQVASPPRPQFSNLLSGVLSCEVWQEQRALVRLGMAWPEEGPSLLLLPVPSPHSQVMTRKKYLTASSMMRFATPASCQLKPLASCAG